MQRTLLLIFTCFLLASCSQNRARSAEDHPAHANWLGVVEPVFPKIKLELFNARKSLVQTDNVSPKVLAVGAHVLVRAGPVEFVISAVTAAAENKTDAIHVRCEPVVRRP